MSSQEIDLNIKEIKKKLQSGDLTVRERRLLCRKLWALEGTYATQSLIEKGVKI